MLDKRGTGLSDRVAGIADIESRMDDVRAVMDAAGSERAAILGVSEGGPMSILFAATYPERTAAAILYGTYASSLRNEDFPFEDTREAYLDAFKEMAETWGTREWLEERLAMYAPSLAGDPDVRRWWPRFTRMSASPGAAVQLARMNMEIDVRHVLPTIRVPTLVMSTTDDKVVDVRYSRYLADRIPGAEYAELPGSDHSIGAPSPGR